MNAQDLKNSILQSAIQGKLVEQRDEEGAAEELYQQIQEVKAKLIKEGQIKKEKPLAEITEEEIPFDIPNNWKWVRLGDLCDYIQRGKSPKYSDFQKYPVVSQKCNQWSGFSLEKAKFIDPNTISSYREERFLVDGDLMWNSTGLGTLGRVAIYEEDKNPYELAVADSHVTVIRPLKHYISYKYLYYYIANPSVQNVIVEQSSGSTKQIELATTTVRNYIVPLPPLDEQKRVVAKIEELTPYVEKYHKAYSEVEDLNKKFPEDMHKSILQYAIQGKLVEQREEEGTAEELFQQIQEEKERLTKEGKIKKIKKLPEIKEEEIPFEKPDSWKFVRLGDVVEFQGGSQPPKGTFKDTPQEGYIRLIQIRDFKSDTFKTYIPYDKAKRFFNEDDIMIGRYGPPVFQILRGLSGAYNVALMKAKPNEEVLTKDFLFYLLKAPFIQTPVIEESSRTAGQSGVRKELIESFVIGIPPLSEQKRIVDKIEAMYELTDRIKS